MEIGGYFECEKYYGVEYHTGCKRLNTARNCIKYLIESRDIKKIWISRWNCSAVLDTCKDNGVELRFFNLDDDLKPVMPPDFHPSDYVYVVNYYGQLSNVNYEHIIMDNSQAFFQRPIKGVDTIYNCRKFFGVSDGAYLYTDSQITRALDRDFSWDRIGYIAGRMEKNATEFYSAYRNNENMLDSLPVKLMSCYTENLLRSLDYDKIKKRREENYRYLNDKLGKYNIISAKETEGPFAYPLMVKDGRALREYLREREIYIAKLWPNVWQGKEGILAEQILPLPCDQRYSVLEMEKVAELIICYLRGGIEK